MGPEFSCRSEHVSKLEAFIVQLIATIVIAAAISIIMHRAEAAPLHHHGCDFAIPLNPESLGERIAPGIGGQFRAPCLHDPCSCGPCSSAALPPSEASEGLDARAPQGRRASATLALSGIDPNGILRPPRLGFA
jgi:hypothetical protein